MAELETVGRRSVQFSICFFCVALYSTNGNIKEFWMFKALCFLLPRHKRASVILSSDFKEPRLGTEEEKLRSCFKTSDNANRKSTGT